MKFKEHATGIVQYDNIFDAKEFLPLLEEECQDEWGYLQWERSLVGRGDVSEIRSSLSCELSPITIEETISHERTAKVAAAFKAVHAPIDKCVWDYRSTYELDLEADEGYRVLKYSGGGNYAAHYDHFRDNSRSLSLVAFLNDDFSGGHLTFPRFGVRIEPQRGSVILFPSNFPYVHIAEPVGLEDGTIKYSLVTWFR